MNLDKLHELNGKLALYAQDADTDLDRDRFESARHDLAAIIAEAREASREDRLTESERPQAWTRHALERELLKELEGM